jgi:hypothetical protein
MSLIEERTETGFAPVIICDWCKKRIEFADDGNTEWQFDRPEIVFHTHKRCCRSFEDGHGEWLTDELSATFVYLAEYNCKVRWKSAKQRMGLLSSPFPSTSEEQAIRERSLLTPSLRYHVLERDGFACRLCGRTVSDGVKLHVDHVLPICKDGKSTVDNLQTLCEECNVGKGGK